MHASAAPKEVRRHTRVWPLPPLKSVRVETATATLKTMQAGNNNDIQVYNEHLSLSATTATTLHTQTVTRHNAKDTKRNRAQTNYAN